MNSAAILGSLVFDAFADLRETADALGALRESAFGLLHDDLPPQTREHVQELFDEIDKLCSRLDGYASHTELDPMPDVSAPRLTDPNPNSLIP